MSAPGTKLIERDISQTISLDSNNTIGIYGQAERGRIDELIFLTNDSDVVSLLGNENIQKYGFGITGAKIALEGTNKVYFARATSENTLFASLNILKKGNNEVYTQGLGYNKTQFRTTSFLDPNDAKTVLVVVSDWPGNASNDISINFTNWDKNYKTFSVNVYYKDKEGNVIDTGEVFDSCSFIRGKTDGYGNSTFIEDKINQKSNYIRVKINENLNETDLEVNEALFTNDFNQSQLILTGGSDGDVITEQDIKDAIDLFSDPLTSDVNIVPDLGEAQENNTAIQQYLVTVSEKRFNEEGAQFHVPITAPRTLKNPQAIANWAGTVLNINSSFASVFAPFLKSRNSRTNANIEIPSSLLVAKMLASADLGKSILGLNRGLIYSKNYVILEPTVAFNKAQQGILYDARVNPIITYPGIGTVVWGQKTRQYRPSALDRINVRRTLDYIELNLMRASKQYIGEINDTETRQNLFNDMTLIGQDALSKGAIIDFACKCDSENNTGSIIDQKKLLGYFAVKPAITVEWVEITAIITRQDAVLTEILN